jgi:hypothetical protein
VDAYTVPEYRGRHVAAGLRTFRNRCLLEWGYEENVSAVREDNLPSLAFTYDKSAQRRVQRLTYLRLLWFSRTWVEEDARMILENHLQRAGRASRVRIHD